MDISVRIISNNNSNNNIAIKIIVIIIVRILIVIIPKQISVRTALEEHLGAPFSARDFVKPRHCVASYPGGWYTLAAVGISSLCVSAILCVHVIGSSSFGTYPDDS